MKRSLPIIVLMWAFLAVQYIHAQKPAPINPFAGEIVQSTDKFINGLPEGWTRSVGNFDCIIKFEKGALYFERHSPDEKCSVTFTKEGVSNGKYLLTTSYKIDGNAVEVLVNGESIKKKHQVEVKDGTLSVTIRTNSKGKAWGWIRKMILLKNG